MAAVTYLFGFSSYGVERNYGGKDCLLHACVSNDIRFEQLIESQISLNSNQPFLCEKLSYYFRSYALLFIAIKHHKDKRRKTNHNMSGHATRPCLRQCLLRNVCIKSPGKINEF